ncbi:Heterokaryon incompatibility protein 6,OR allele [Lachnellula subtilissima]|uniref:Heterokaryon incompatibility protein 6,OR allele n=1 Tax=Lachnellula subtilissima TaxID=602034 RepID=A0A8H8RFV3_9HELO|nr:Heterokaryon incompatibility protein 6,OR allele [Lachnellula subtilissima]
MSTSNTARPTGADRARRTVNLWQRAVDVTRNPTTYSYKNIDYERQIRVLKIYKGGRDDRLEGCLLPRSLVPTKGTAQDEPPIQYTALSYYWGTDAASNKIYLYNDDTAQATITSNIKARGALDLLKSISFLYIQNNLNAALRQLRSEEDEIYVWTDAVCIHQKDVEEKTIQVSLMHEVYAQAEDVCIWFGDTYGEDEIQENEQTFAYLGSILDLKALDDHVERLKVREPLDMKLCKNVVKLMESDWFKRRWIIQELALATNAYVRRGTCIMRWTDFADSIAFFMTKVQYIRDAYEPGNTYSRSLNSDDNSMRNLEAGALGANLLIEVNSNLFRKSKEGQIQQRLLSLEQLVSALLLPFQATDPKDTIFAVLQIAKDTTSCSRALMGRNEGKMIVAAIFQLSVIVAVLAIFMANFDVIELDSESTFFLSHSNRSLLRRILKSLLPPRGPSPIRDSNNEASLALKALWVLRLSLLSLFIFMVCKFQSVVNFVDRVLLNPVVRRFRGQNPTISDKRLEPNYQKRLIDVYGDFIEHSVETSNSLDILCRHWAPRQNSTVATEDDIKEAEKIPSWILDINDGGAFFRHEGKSAMRANADCLVGDSYGRRWYSASGTLSPVYNFRKRAVAPDRPKKRPRHNVIYAEASEKGRKLPQRFNGTLDVDGFQLGSIEETTEIAGGVLSKKALRILGWSDQTKPSSEGDIDQLWRTMVANRGPGGSNPPNWYRRVCISCLEWFQNQGVADFSTVELKRLGDTPRQKVKFLDRVHQVVWNRKCFRTVNKHGKHFVGLAPPGAEAGDLICILFGCSVPVVLKRTEKTFKFVGECYVHGMMDGEAVDPTFKRSKTQTFRLS